MLTLTNLSRRYGAVQALRDVSFDIRAGEVHALMGENGAGKSTLIRLLAGLERPDNGEIALNGAPVSLDAPARAEAVGLRFIHQELHVVPALSVAENMHLHLPYPTRLGLIRWRDLSRRAATALSRLGLGHIDPRATMAHLSASDRMLTRIAATLITQGPAPWLYVMDEPTAALTGTEAARLFAVIGELTARGAGVLYVSHRMAEVTRLAARVTVLRDGHHVSTRAMTDTDQNRIIGEMTGRDLSALFPPRRTVPAAPPILTLDRGGNGMLTDITLALAPGEVLGIAGLAGSGRGALLRALIGAQPWIRGRMQIAGADTRPRTPAEGWGAGLAYIPRERRSEGLMMLRAISENISLPHLAALSRGGFLARRAEAELTAIHGARVRLTAASPRAPAHALSGGNQQKVLFARALAGQPKVLLLDEPTRGVDVGAKHDIYRLIAGLCGTGTGVILASSDLPELIGLSDRILVLHAGRTAHLVANDGLTEADLLSLCYKEQAA